MMMMMMMMKTSQRPRLLALALALLITIACSPSAAAQNTTTTTTTTCSTATLTTLLPCQGYFSSGNSSTPDALCCTPLKAILDANATCLCELPSLLAGAGVSSLNVTRASDVASACNLKVPNSVIQCLSPNSTTPSSTPTPSGESGSSSASPRSLDANDWGLLITIFYVLYITCSYM